MVWACMHLCQFFCVQFNFSSIFSQFNDISQYVLSFLNWWIAMCMSSSFLSHFCSFCYVKEKYTSPFDSKLPKFCRLYLIKIDFAKGHFRCHCWLRKNHISLHIGTWMDICLSSFDSAHLWYHNALYCSQASHSVKDFNDEEYHYYCLIPLQHLFSLPVSKTSWDHSVKPSWILLQ